MKCRKSLCQKYSNIKSARFVYMFVYIFVSHVVQFMKCRKDLCQKTVM